MPLISFLILYNTSSHWFWNWAWRLQHVNHTLHGNYSGSFKQCFLGFPLPIYSSQFFKELKLNRQASHSPAGGVLRLQKAASRQQRSHGHRPRSSEKEGEKRGSIEPSVVGKQGAILLLTCSSFRPMHWLWSLLCMDHNEALSLEISLRHLLCIVRLFCWIQHNEQSQHSRPLFF